MSYILEALKKSQQEREMGQVPRLQATAFDEPIEPTRPQPWVYAAVGLAALAVLVALFALLRPASTPDASMASPVAIKAELDQGAGAAAGVGQGSKQATAAGLETDADLGPGLDRAGSAAPLRLTDPDDLSVESQVLVVPAAPKPGERLPRGADELRRAVLGPDASPSVERRQSSPDPTPPERQTPPERDYTPVPPELIAEIEEFKRTYQTGASSASAVGKEAAPARSATATSEMSKRSAGNSTPASRQASASGRPAPLSSTLRRQLPPFLMTVHVFDEDPARRFVYLNGSKVREGELTRDGFFVEQVLADGAIVRYDDHRFFESP